MSLLFLCILLTLYCTVSLSPCKERLINFRDEDNDDDTRDHEDVPFSETFAEPCQRTIKDNKKSTISHCKRKRLIHENSLSWVSRSVSGKRACRYHRSSVSKTEAVELCLVNCSH